MSQSISRFRNAAFIRQNGLCYYCAFPMWTTDLVLFTKQQSISTHYAKRFHCTAEHLTPRSDGGKNTNKNIVAACFYCNTHRHRLKVIPAPDEFRQYVQKRLAKGRWHF